MHPSSRKSVEEEDREPAWFKEIRGRERAPSTPPPPENNNSNKARDLDFSPDRATDSTAGVVGRNNNQSRKRRAEEKDAWATASSTTTATTATTTTTKEQFHSEHHHPSTSSSGSAKSTRSSAQPGQQQMRSPRGGGADAAVSPGLPSSGSCVANYPPDLSFTSVSHNFLRGIMRAAGGPLGIGRSSPAAGSFFVFCARNLAPRE